MNCGPKQKTLGTQPSYQQTQITIWECSCKLWKGATNIAGTKVTVKNISYQFCPMQFGTILIVQKPPYKASHCH